MVKWLRINLGLAMFVLSVLSGATGAVVSGTLRIARFDFRLDTIERAMSEDRGRIEAQEAQDKETMLHRITLAEDLARIRARLDSIEAQQIFVGGFIREALIPRVGSRTVR